MANDEVAITIKGKDEASPAIRGVSGGFKRLETAVNQGNKSLRSLSSTMGSAMSNVNAAMSRAMSSARSLTGQLAGIASTVGKVTAATGALAAGGLAALAVKGSQVSAQFESSRIAFESMLGSAEKANALLNQLTAFAAQTPFELEDVITGSQRLLAFGFAAEKIIPTFRTLGDAVAALGGGRDVLNRVLTALGQIIAKGRVQGEELMQLAEAGIPAYQILQQQLRLTGDQIGRIGDLGIDANTVIDALTRGLAQRFGGAMTRLSNTVPVMFSNLKDSITQALRDIGDALKPFVIDLLSTLQRAIAELRASGALQSIFQSLGQVILNVSNALKTFIQSGQLRAFFASVGQVIGRVVQAFANLASSQNLVNIFQKMSDAVQRLAANMNEEMARKIIIIGAALAALPLVLPLIATGLNLVASAATVVFATLAAGVQIIASLTNALSNPALLAGFATVAAVFLLLKGGDLKRLDLSGLGQGLNLSGGKPTMESVATKAEILGEPRPFPRHILIHGRTKEEMEQKAKEFELQLERLDKAYTLMAKSRVKQARAEGREPPKELLEIAEPTSWLDKISPQIKSVFEQIKNVFIDGLKGFKDAVAAKANELFPKTATGAAQAFPALQVAARQPALAGGAPTMAERERMRIAAIMANAARPHIVSGRPQFERGANEIVVRIPLEVVDERFVEFFRSFRQGR